MDYQVLTHELKNLNHDNIEIIRTSRGLPSARNLAIKSIGDTDIVHFLDDDVTVGKTYFRDVEFFLQNNLDAHGGAPIERVSTIHKSRSERFPLKQWLGMKQEPGKVTISMRNYWGPIFSPEELKVDWLPGLAMFFRKSSLNEKYFNEKLEEFTLGPYGLGEDLMFTLSLSMSGYNLYALPNLEVSHAKLPNPSNTSTNVHYAIGELRAELFQTYPKKFNKVVYLISIMIDCLLQILSSPLKLKPIIECSKKEFQGFYKNLAN